MASPSNLLTGFDALRSTTEMPLSGVRYRFKDLGDGKKQRLAFRGKRVVEAKSYQDGKPTGAIHTPAEFKRDTMKQRRPFRATRGKS